MNEDSSSNCNAASLEAVQFGAGKSAKIELELTGLHDTTIKLSRYQR